MTVGFGDAETKAVMMAGRDEVEMECLLTSGLSIGDEPVDAIAFEDDLERLRDSAGKGEEMGGGRVVLVGNVWRVALWG